jgi:RNA-directed DNA polymerase
MIPKPGGGERPLGIPTVRDRVVQTAVVLILGPIFEADFEDNVYAYRPERSAHDALDEVSRRLYAGQQHVVDADVQKYFDTIPHADLLKSVARRIADGKILHLLKLWLKEAADGSTLEEIPEASQGEGQRPAIPWKPDTLAPAERPPQSSSQGMGSVLQRRFHRPSRRSGGLACAGASPPLSLQAAQSEVQ